MSLSRGWDLERLRCLGLGGLLRRPGVELRRRLVAARPRWEPCLELLSLLRSRLLRPRSPDSELLCRWREADRDRDLCLFLLPGLEVVARRPGLRPLPLREFLSPEEDLLLDLRLESDLLRCLLRRGFDGLRSGML
jgi:hypothetical protein